MGRPKGRKDYGVHVKTLILLLIKFFTEEKRILFQFLTECKILVNFLPAICRFLIEFILIVRISPSLFPIKFTNVAERVQKATKIGMSSIYK